MASRLEKNDFELETVLVLQGGGSLGAYECGVYKALARYVKKFDIVAGTSIGAINAAIITATIQDENPSRKLEDFWLELAQSIGSPIPLLLSEKTRRIMSTIFAATWGNPKPLFLNGWSQRVLLIQHSAYLTRYLIFRHLKKLLLSMLILNNLGRENILILALLGLLCVRTNTICCQTANM
ncbi:MAG: patatin-like phospholipase family protein [Candidatus Nitrosopolaris sp.]